MPKRGRRPGDTDTREQILVAARVAFADLGYDRATIRRIAADAQVDPALVHHYFGSKEGLFAAAVDVPFAPLAGIDAIFAGGSGDAGVGLARFFLTVWEDEQSRSALLGQLRRGLSEGTMAPPFRQFLERVLLPRFTRHMEPPDASLRVELAAAHLVGLAVLRYVVELEPIVSEPVDRLAELVGERIQPYLDGTAPI